MVFVNIGSRLLKIDNYHLIRIPTRMQKLLFIKTKDTTIFIEDLFTNCKKMCSEILVRRLFKRLL